MAKSATIRDVAKAANVSPATVSRAFVRPEKVDDATRERVLKTAAQLDYKPNKAARSLITGLTGNIGIVVPDLTNPFFPAIVRGIQARAEELGFASLLVDTGEDAEKEAAAAARLAQQVDGLILCSPRMEDDALIQLAAAHNIVMINRELLKIPAVTIDNQGGIEKVVEHLKALGHQRIGYVAGPESSYSCVSRREAASAGLAAAGLEEVFIGSYEPSFDGGRAAAQQVLLSNVSAVMVYNDVMSLGLLNQLAEYGISVPEDMTVIGFDDIEFASMSSPSLTTVHVPRQKVGTMAMSYLHELMTSKDNEHEAPAMVSTHFVFRGTSKRFSPA